MSAPSQDAESRRYTKRLILPHSAAAWIAIGMSIWLGGAEVVVPSMSILITGLGGVDSGTGHLDYRAFPRGGEHEK